MLWVGKDRYRIGYNGRDTIQILVVGRRYIEYGRGLGGSRGTE